MCEHHDGPVDMDCMGCVLAKTAQENEKLRMLLWLNHGHDGLYGDDGEMQCSKCMIDFRRDSADSMEQKWYRHEFFGKERA